MFCNVLHETVNHVIMAKHNRNSLKIGKIVHFYNSYCILRHQDWNCKIHVIILWKPFKNESILTCLYVKPWITLKWCQFTIEIVWKLAKYFVSIIVIVFQSTKIEIVKFMSLFSENHSKRKVFWRAFTWNRESG